MADFNLQTQTAEDLAAFKRTLVSPTASESSGGENFEPVSFVNNPPPQFSESSGAPNFAPVSFVNQTPTPSTTQTSTYQGNSIVDYLKSIGSDASFRERKILAEQNGITGYRGADFQNVQLLQNLRGKQTARTGIATGTPPVVNERLTTITPTSIDVDSPLDRTREETRQENIRTAADTASPVDAPAVSVAASYETATTTKEIVDRYRAKEDADALAMREKHQSYIDAAKKVSTDRAEMMERLRELDDPRTTQIEGFGIDQKIQQLMEINTRMATMANQFEAAVGQVEAGTGLSTTIAGKAGQLRRQQAIELGGMAMTAQALQGNITLAKETAKEMVDLEFAAEEAELEAQKATLELNYDEYDRKQKNSADELTIEINERQRILTEERAEKDNIYNLAINAIGQGVSNEGVQAILDSKDYGLAIRAYRTNAPSSTGGDFQFITGTDNQASGYFDKNTGTFVPYGSSPSSANVWDYPTTNTAGGSIPGGATGQIVTDASGVTYDIGTYATDPTHEAKIQSILNNMGKMDSVEAIDNYIKTVAPGSPVTGSMIASASAEYGTSWETMMAMMQQDSSFATAGKGARTYNPGNVGNTDSGAEVNYGDWQSGVDAVARNLSRRIVDGSGAGDIQAAGNTPPIPQKVQTIADLVNGGTYTAKEGGAQLDTDMERDQLNYLLNNTQTDSQRAADLDLADKVAAFTSLKDAPGLDSSVGPVGITRIGFLDRPTGAKRYFLGQMDSFLDQFSLKSLIKAKQEGATFGQLSDKEMQILSSAASALSSPSIAIRRNGELKGFRINQKDFATQMDNIIKVLNNSIKNVELRSNPAVQDPLGVISNDGGFTDNSIEDPLDLGL